MASSEGHQETSEDFQKRISKMGESAFSFLSLTLGSRLGLLRVLKEMDGPCTAKDLAEKAGCKKRYVEEWLGSMVCADILEVQEVSETGSDDLYFLPRHRVGALFDASFLSTLGFQAMIDANQDLMKAIRKDGPGGLGFDAHPFMHDWRTQVLEVTFGWDVLKGYISSVPGLYDKFTSGLRVLCLGCGSAFVECQLAKNFPNSSFHCIDMSEVALEQANQRKRDNDLTNITFSFDDICNMPADWSERYDVAFGLDFLHDLSQPALGAREASRVLRPQGLMLCIDVDALGSIAKNRSLSYAAMVYVYGLYYCVPISLHDPQGKGFGPLCGRERIRKVILENGFSDVLEPERHEGADTMQLLYVCYK